MYLTQLEELFENDGSGQPKAKNGNRPITDFVGRGQSPAVASALQYKQGLEGAYHLPVYNLSIKVVYLPSFTAMF
ncbi:uncharacterized protein TRIREDRAFT_107339 [Trichoderma reesei QM6a]|uniref:Predicted protein n=2 Tax=Hypocrea jecorina TaxID=51453 RepID=G0RJE1_HYPJQ|nr:uncharacterized protein TRIREDRAFT_107339 [Trichoderma reesei QM6a]EGR48574.1 predicted protein [Trichoderma reesei QM6a]ETS01466.1 hypothetical protein M419DRAFT_80977 [Trichoderma reesei RUT C-30]